MDKWGGSNENRARFGLEVTKAVIDAVGDSKKVGMRLSPWATGQGMRMKDPVPQFSHIVSELKKLNIAYLHLIESRVAGRSAVDAVYRHVTRENDPFIEIWGPEAPIILAGGFDADKAKRITSEVYLGDNVLIAFGRYWISNPDLPFRVQHGIELQPYDRRTFYKANTNEGYTTYPFSKEWRQQESRL
jgi:NADPH2 dehydrogenase